MQLPDAAIGSIIAAAIAGLVVFISTVLTKEQKTSEFRQSWIDELRKDISQYISGATEIVALYTAKTNDKAAQAKFLDENFKLVHELQAIEHRIVLRLNPKEHATLIAQITGFRQSMLDAYSVASASASVDANLTRQTEEQRLTKELLDSAKFVLKSEWKRVKRGEPAFRIVKWTALAAIIILAYLFLRSDRSPLKQPQTTEQRTGSENDRTSQIVIENQLECPSFSTATNVGRVASAVKSRKRLSAAPPNCQPGK
ncbi:hypothetical protein [Paraburkholderia sp. D1E]|uniref:hypothetical protein n=1 Tax=Paraburkholderia sp. D1E TaxID=3461398 RepID=UPI004045E007